MVINIGCQLGVTENTILENVVYPRLLLTKFVTSVLEAIMFITVNNEVTRLFLFVFSLTNAVYNSSNSTVPIMMAAVTAGIVGLPDWKQHIYDYGSI
jgi:hypothetical protein